MRRLQVSLKRFSLVVKKGRRAHARCCMHKQAEIFSQTRSLIFPALLAHSVLALAFDSRWEVLSRGLVVLWAFLFLIEHYPQRRCKEAQSFFVSQLYHLNLGRKTNFWGGLLCHFSFLRQFEDTVPRSFHPTSDSAQHLALAVWWIIHMAGIKRKSMSEELDKGNDFSSFKIFTITTKKTSRVRQWDE